MMGAVVVTCAEGGIGRACGGALVERGASVTVVARGADMAEEVAHEGRDTGVAASAHGVDTRGVVRGPTGWAGERTPDDPVGDRASMARMLGVSLLGPAASATALAPHPVTRPRFSPGDDRSNPRRRRWTVGSHPPPESLENPTSRSHR